jgi:hypothetical protein
MKVKVVGAKRWAGTVDGDKIDSAKLFVEVRLDDTRNGRNNGNDAWAGGIAIEEIKLPNGLYLADLESHINRGGKFPVECEVTTERVSNGKTVRELVTEVKVLDQAGQQPVKNPLKAA